MGQERQICVDRAMSAVPPLATKMLSRSKRSGRATADHQHLGFGENWNFARGLEKRFAGADVPHPITAAKQLKTLNGADAAAVITAAWGIAYQSVLS